MENQNSMQATNDPFAIGARIKRLGITQKYVSNTLLKQKSSATLSLLLTGKLIHPEMLDRTIKALDRYEARKNRKSSKVA